MPIHAGIGCAQELLARAAVPGVQRQAYAAGDLYGRAVGHGVPQIGHRGLVGHVQAGLDTDAQSVQFRAGFPAGGDSPAGGVIPKVVLGPTISVPPSQDLRTCPEHLGIARPGVLPASRKEAT